MTNSSVVSRRATVFFLAGLGLLCVSACASPVGPSDASIGGTWHADVGSGPFSALAVDLRPATTSPGFTGAAYATRRECAVNDRYPCLLAGLVLAGSQQAGSVVTINLTFPDAPLGASFTGVARSDGSMRGTLEVRNGTPDTPTRTTITFYR